MTPDVVEVRPVTDADREGVMALAPRLAEGVAAWRDRSAAIAAAGSWLADSLARAAEGRAGVFVAVRGGTVVGVVSVSEQRHFTGAVDGYVGELAVAAHASRQGVGRLLMAAAERWARDRGLRHLTLQTGAANATALRFYEALGYRPEEIRLTRALD
ncbi:GNAT family N-acetyltransferase [Streptomyces millisiae]|uniref:GNAT family N-acetyltransferase n=1 Tax=Streptomyces millisiae TaxID=3075542 RepID=A0ABU2LX61_9ACTN|nr:GNAT family N-acetyltransferase [Streptomyces sp. DSM 44918]MDT0322139.1 GNAT family N-acetyltransferase [Streptomyces sp. DSM 44918]